MRLGETYYWLRFWSESGTREADQDQLFELGALGLEEEGADGEVVHPDAASSQPLWLKASFGEAGAFAAAKAAYADRPGFSSGTAEVEDWDQTWRDRQEPVAVTGRLTVLPPWLPTPEAGHVIRLTAKMAFGTGLHESTQLAAALLEKLDLANKTVLDIGAGTGILALYTAQLGARRAIAHDIDVVTGPCMAENKTLNPLHEGRDFVGFVGTTDALKTSADFDCIVCNMIRTEWWPFRAELISRTAPQGILVISGQRLDDKPLVLPWLASQGFAPCHEVNKNEWWAVAAARIVDME
jgi:ribosomal protein L11 methyltransferase